MTIYFHYNWPTVHNSISISFGLANVVDQDYLFRVGVVPTSDKENIYWQGDKEWHTFEELNDTHFAVTRGDKVVVDKKQHDGDKVEDRCLWDTNEDWPIGAQGGTSTYVPFSF
ncbi:MAG: hypothetical protein HYT93_05190 [Parcubacteria group bacterium]|nr:hypothetical protein [Parcubacteria group bacterium]